MNASRHRANEQERSNAAPSDHVSCLLDDHDINWMFEERCPDPIL